MTCQARLDWGTTPAPDTLTLVRANLDYRREWVHYADLPGCCEWGDGHIDLYQGACEVVGAVCGGEE